MPPTTYGGRRTRPDPRSHADRRSSDGGVIEQRIVDRTRQRLAQSRKEIRELVDATKRYIKSSASHEQVVAGFADCLTTQAHAELARDDTSAVGAPVPPCPAAPP